MRKWLISISLVVSLCGPVYASPMSDAVEATWNYGINPINVLVEVGVCVLNGFVRILTGLNPERIIP